MLCFTNNYGRIIMAKNKKTTEDMESVGYGYGYAEEEVDKDGKKKVKGKAVVYAGKKKSKQSRKEAAKKLLDKLNNKEK